MWHGWKLNVWLRLTRRHWWMRPSWFLKSDTCCLFNFGAVKTWGITLLALIDDLSHYCTHMGFLTLFQTVTSKSHISAAQNQVQILMLYAPPPVDMGVVGVGGDETGTYTLMLFADTLSLYSWRKLRHTIHHFSSSLSMFFFQCPNRANNWRTLRGGMVALRTSRAALDTEK